MPLSPLSARDPKIHVAVLQKLTASPALAILPCLVLPAVNRFDTGIGAKRSGDMGQVARIVHVDINIDVEEIRLTMMHAQLDDVPACLADNCADLPKNTR